VDLDIDTRFEAGYAVVTPKGEIDLSTVEAFREVLLELIIQGHVHLLIDLDRVDFIDSLGFGALVAARRKARTFKGTVGIICTNGRVLRLFAVTELERVFTITDSIEGQPTRA
jgi:anti-sigma B factor antagonist